MGVVPRRMVPARIPCSVGGPGQGVGVRVGLALSGLIKETFGLWRRGRVQLLASPDADFSARNPRSSCVGRAFLRTPSRKMSPPPPPRRCQPSREPFHLDGAEWSAKRARPPVSSPLANGITVIGVGDTAAHFGLLPRQRFKICVCLNHDYFRQI